MDSLVDKVFCDRYQIQSLLGRQTGRRTLLATDLATDSSVVVKLLLFGPDLTWDDLKLFEREADVLKSLDHPAIPKYLDYFEVDTELGKGFALVQTYIQAKSLQDWIQEGRTFAEDDLKAIGKDLLNILDYLHQRQPPVVHRDIKPSNILLADHGDYGPGQVYLIDFGSVQTAVHGGTRTIVGTYGYMPPEQFGGETTSASDLYAFGATLIYLATGCHPDKLPQREMRILFEDRVSLRPSLIDWLKWLIEPSLDLRLNSAKQAIDALENSKTRGRGLARVAKPIGSKVQLTNTSQMLEICVPPRGFYTGLIPVIVFAMVWNSFLLLWYTIVSATWNSIGWLLGLFAVVHLAVGFLLILMILENLFAKFRLRITNVRIVRSSALFGMWRWTVPPAFREDIEKVELTHSQIIICARTQKFTLGGEGWGGCNLTAPELSWLAQEVSHWLKLPLIRDPETITPKMVE
ncbi:MAG: serine/threonine-protein kinase [Leptolyngbyaceae cyanobacterium MO_188.B28]|nr:serine/threonine-protein kinase [Leptolyngbyaceae cyanobacterium MO_188.B28]